MPRQHTPFQQQIIVAKGVPLLWACMEPDSNFKQQESTYPRETNLSLSLAKGKNSDRKRHCHILPMIKFFMRAASSRSAADKSIFLRGRYYPNCAALGTGKGQVPQRTP